MTDRFIAALICGGKPVTREIWLDAVAPEEDWTDPEMLASMPEPRDRDAEGNRDDRE